MVIPTTVPHAGPESSRGTAPLCIDGRKAPCRTTATFPRTTGLCSSATRCSADRSIAGFIAAPSGNTVGCVPPERDQELACKRHDHNLAKAPSCLADAFAEPDYLRRAWLVALPEPSQLHHHRSEPSIAGFPYALWRSSPPLLYGVAVSPAYAPSALPLANRRTKASRTSTVALCTPIPRKPASC